MSSRTPVQYDYGGNSYGSRRGIKITNDSRRSYRCLDCNKLRYVFDRELNRAGRQACLACGGPLQETDANRKEKGLPKLQSKPKKPKASYRCPGCGKNIKSGTGVHQHVLASKGCFEGFAEKLGLVPYKSLLILPGTAKVDRRGQAYVVMVVGASQFSTEPSAFEVYSLKHKVAAELWAEATFSEDNAVQLGDTSA